MFCWNKDSDNQCVACETARPGAIIAAVTAATTATGQTASSSIGVGSFSFGGTIDKATSTTSTSTSAIGAGGFAFGGNSATTTSGIGAGGFSFVHPVVV